jgi:hypothetical protein
VIALLTPDLGDKCIAFSQLHSWHELIPYPLLTSRWLAASNSCALYDLYYLALFAVNARRNPYLAG